MKAGREYMTRLRGLLVVLATLACATWSDCVRADETFDSNGVKINYSSKGQGEPVILIHGWLSSGWINWDLPGTTALLAKNYRVIWLDMPAHGRSDRPTSEEAYGLKLVEHVVRLMDHLKIKKAHVVGYSMGGIITLKLIATHPDRVLSGTLGGMGWLREGSFEQKVFATAGRDAKPVGICFKSLAKLALTEAEVKAIKTPVVILFGDKDPIRKGYTEPLKRVRTDWNVIDIKDADHISCVAKPQFKEEIQKWLAERTKQ
jgi:pimeloyl-ACP methyl ester carboxylesterase